MACCFYFDFKMFVIQQQKLLQILVSCHDLRGTVLSVALSGLKLVLAEGSFIDFLTSPSGSFLQVLRQIRKLPWDDPQVSEIRCETKVTPTGTYVDSTIKLF